ncbi:hypothetical protein ANCCAN_23811, partial [Ancylostoma caninum]
KAPCRAGTINNVKFINDGAIATVSAGGRRKPLSYFNGQLRERMNLDKEEPEPARVHYSITMSSLSTPCLAKKSSRTNRRCVRVNFDDYSNNEKDDLQEESIEEGNECDSVENSRKVTLGDFFANTRATQSKRPRINTPEFDGDLAGKQLLTTPASLVEIGKAVNAPHIFEVVELNIKRIMNDFDLKKEASHLS